MPAVIIPLKERSKLSPPAEDRYRKCLGEAAWFRLPDSVRRRFSKRLGEAEQTIYRGEVAAMELSRWGWLLAQAGRMLGAPLPFTRDALGPCVVVVTESAALGGQIWSRSYPRPGRFPQVVHSAKRFAGPSGIEEYLGRGLVMRLALEEEAGQMIFRSAGFAIEVAGRTLRVPDWLIPLRCTVIHRAETDARFSFTLIVENAVLGRLVHQVAFFQDA
ncbi:unnamed protein product [Phaeothamnion confervicola]